jgi:galactose oxidase
MSNDPAVIGQWEAKFDLQNVAIHAHLLPTGEVLYWGRRAMPGNTQFSSLNEHVCSTFLWDPVTSTSRPTAQNPQLDSTNGVNLFCSGHSFLSDGRLLVAGGHLFDNEGVNQACLYDPFADKWTPLERMNNGRWYPSVLTLPDGGVFVISGSYADGQPQPPPDISIDTFPPISTNHNPQIWRSDAWGPTRDYPAVQLYPRLHIEPKQGHIFMAGPQGDSSFLDIAAAGGAGTWTPGPTRVGGFRDYAPSVMYESGKIIFMGGGLDADTKQPTTITEIIDLNDQTPTWTQVMDMNFRRRQHNATVLPDGTVLVTGGTQGHMDDISSRNFNDVTQGAPVHQAELWDPATKKWTLMAAEDVDRCYHSTALLLPDGRVLSAGGGEWAPTPGVSNDPDDSHADAQVFKPPYLFKGPQPTILSAPSEITYGQIFNVVLDAMSNIGKVSWIRLGSVTHSCNQNQSLNFLQFQQTSLTLTIQAPASANITPPGHYMLFVLNDQGVPSIAPIVRIEMQNINTRATHAFLTQQALAAIPTTASLPAIDRNIIANDSTPPVVVGITPTCPYGIGACWGGAFGALQRLKDVQVVRPVPDRTDSTAFVYLKQNTLPELEVWRHEFAKCIKGTYSIRGIEMTLSGFVIKKLHKLTLAGTKTPLDLVLEPLQAADIVQWDSKKRANRPMSESEASAVDRLFTALAGRPEVAAVQITGPLKKNGVEFSLQVRDFKVDIDSRDIRGDNAQI